MSVEASFQSLQFYRLWSVLTLDVITRFVNEEHHLEFEVEPGMMEGMEHKFHSEGEPHMDGEPGDLVLNIRTYPHTRNGSILYKNFLVIKLTINKPW